MGPHVRAVAAAAGTPHGREPGRTHRTDDRAGPDNDPAVRLRLLNTFELTAAGADVALPLGSQRLLAFLALRNRPLLRLHVAGALWLDSSEERSAACMRSALWRIHRTGWRITESSGQSIRVDRRLQVDVHEASELARRLLDRSQEVERVDGVDMLGEELLPDWYDDWVVVEREQLRQLCLRALEAHAERLFADGTYGPAVDTALAAVRSDPLRESAHRLLIRVHLAEGNWGDAVHQYRLYARLLRKHLGLRPSPQIEELLRGLPRAPR